ncbi:MAG: putative peptidoglycan glycosyltransferase FtsW [Anaerolineae bacterium]|jgi:cell division protein FtsW
MAKQKKARRPYADPDYTLIVAVVGLLIVGSMMNYSATFDWSYQLYGNSLQIALRQFGWVGVGIVAMVVFTFFPYDRWQQLAVPVLGATLLSLILVLFVGDEVFGAQRSFLGGSVHPGELAKLSMVIYIATWLASKGDQIRDVTYGLIPFGVLIGLAAGLIVAQPDLGTAVLITLTSLSVFFFAGAEILQLAAGGAIGSVTFVLLVSKFPHAADRINGWREVWNSPQKASYHMQQTLIALGSGGLLGTGLGQGQQKLGYLPTPHTDTIFAVLGEEAGFVGCLLVIGLYVLFAYRGFKIAMEAQDPFAALLASGVTCWITFEALINLGVVTGLLPFTGMVLPFISSGGSAMVTSMAGVGLLLSVSRGKSPGRREESRQDASLDRRWGNRGTRLSGAGSRPGASRRG